MLHKNSPKRYYLPDKTYFVVIKTFNNFPYFKEPIFCELLIKELKLCKKLKGFKLYGFCLIHDHLNLLIRPNDEFNISKIIQSIKKEFSRDVNYILHPVGAIPESRLRGDQYSWRYNKSFVIPNLSNFQNKFLQKYGVNQNQFPKFQWQKSFYDHIIRDENDLQAHYHYTVYNFLKHSLPNNWQYTSLNYQDLIGLL